MECKYMFMFTLKNLARKGLIALTSVKYKHGTDYVTSALIILQELIK